MILSMCAALFQLVEDDPRLVEICRRLEAAGDTAHGDTAHDGAHTLRVTLTALDLAGGRLPRSEVIAACLLHDVVNVPKNSPDRAAAGQLSAQQARKILAEAGYEAVAVDRIAAAIHDHGFSSGAKPTDFLAQVLQDADRIDALGAVGIFRAVSIGERMGSAFYDVDDPWAFDRHPDERAYVIDHFFTKLLRLPSQMNTERGKAEARERAEFLALFLDQLGRELRIPVGAISAPPPDETALRLATHAEFG
jgi:uncharacterized protein